LQREIAVHAGTRTDRSPFDNDRSADHRHTGSIDDLARHGDRLAGLCGRSFLREYDRRILDGISDIGGLEKRIEHIVQRRILHIDRHAARHVHILVVHEQVGGLLFDCTEHLLKGSVRNPEGYRYGLRTCRAREKAAYKCQNRQEKPNSRLVFHFHTLVS
jgi:hypothetical protein